MGLHTTDAIVLRRHLYRETSVIVTCLTDRHGKLKGLVKGLRVQPNRYRSAMEPLTVNRIVFYDTLTSQLHLISQCELLAPLAQLQRDVETAQHAGFCADLIDTIVPLGEPQPTIYRLLHETLGRLALGADDATGVHLHFIVRLLRLAGFQPQVDTCTSCNGTVTTAGYWSARQGGLLCAECLHEDPRADVAPTSLLDMLATLSQADQPPHIEPKLIAVLQQRLHTFLRWRLEYPLKTLEARSWSVPATTSGT